MAHNFNIIGMGNPLLDISAAVPMSVLDKYGLKLNNAVLAEESHMPVYDELVSNYQVEYVAGGATQNSIRVAQWLLQQPRATAIIGCVGDDKYGQQLASCASADGVEVHYLKDTETPTGTCAVLINEKERSLVANLSAANNYKETHLDTIPDIWQNSQVYYSAGFHLTVCPAAMLRVAMHANLTNRQYCLNLSAEFICEFFAEPLMELIPYCDIVFGNESEALAFGKTQKYKDTSVHAVAAQIVALPKANRRPRMVIITQGKDPVVVATPDGVVEFPVAKLDASKIVDTNGAGDAFVGGFLAAKTRQADLKACVAAGQYASSKVLGVSGTSLSGKPTHSLPPRQHTFSILGMGNPLLDISAHVPMSVLEKYGLKLNNAVLAEEEHLPVYPELVNNYNVEYVAGGATQNSIRVAQWMLQQQKATAYIGCVGKDSYGQQLAACASDDGVAVHYLEDAEAPTGTCAVLINEKERSLVANLSAANNYKDSHLATVPHVWQNAAIYYSAGFFLTVSPESMMKVAKHANDHGKLYCLNLSAEFICEFFDKPLMDLMPFCDVVFGNESEALAFGKTQKYKDTSVKAVAAAIAKLYKYNGRPRLVVITQGKDPVVVATGEEVFEFPTPVLSADKIVDTNGAGDAFVGGFLAAKSRGADLNACVKSGMYASSVILGVSGTILSGKPTHSLPATKIVSRL